MRTRFGPPVDDLHVVRTDAHSPDSGRRAHYGEFYGVRPPPPDDVRPLALVWGNCQAESVRVLLAGAGDDRPYRTVRVPPVHEITAADLPHLARLLDRTAVLVTQPVATGYRGLPIGTADVAAGLGDGSLIVRFPVIRWGGLYPAQAIVRAPGAADPPRVPYHDLRTLAVAAGVPLPPLAARACREVARLSIGQLRDRERRHGTVVASDLLATAGADAAHTINHPGNPVLLGVARRVQEAAGWPADAADPGRTLLRSVLAPLEPTVLDALGLGAAPRDAWQVEGARVETTEVRDAHLDWYARHPDVVAAGLARHQEQLRVLAAG